jgi:3-methyladenine DNA glycosylase AlkD
VTSTWPQRVVRATKAALAPLANVHEARQMEQYMKYVAPFLGIRATPRRAAQREQWRTLPIPTSDQLGEGCLALLNLKQREYHHAACDLVAKYLDVCDEYFLGEYVEVLLTTKPWWDTVDGFGSTAVSPLCWRYDATDLVLEWSNSANMWLNRAAIQHQRGWKTETDVDFVLSICDAHSANQEFFIAKAIGWALRDIARLDERAVRRFLHGHPNLSYVAVREAQRVLKD